MGYGMNCCAPGFGGRRFLTTDEKREWLESYAGELENELEAVKQRLSELKAESKKK